MLQRIRQHKTFAAVVIAVFALLLLAAALSGARVRAASPADLVGADVCTTSQMLAVGHEDHALPASWDTVAADSSHGAHTPDCVLCIALAPPVLWTADVHRPPVPSFHLKWRSLPAQLALLEVAAPPASTRPAPALRVMACRQA